MVESIMVDEKLARQPVATDPAEKRIRKVLQDNLVSTAWAKDAFKKATAKLKMFMRNPSSYKTTLDSLNQILNTEIIEGKNYVEQLKGRPFVIVTNHLGTAKVARIRDDGIYPNLDIEPFPIRHCAFKKVSDLSGASIHETAVELPGKLSDIQNAAGVVTIPASGEGRTGILIDKIKSVIAKEKDPVFVMYPEGGTTGKRNGGGAYDLEEFHTGAMVIAKNCNLPILPICQFFNPNSGLELYILPVIFPDQMTTDFGKSASELQVVMQTKFNMLKSTK